LKEKEMLVLIGMQKEERIKMQKGVWKVSVDIKLVVC
jgi:hypothetical protein